MGLTPYEKNVCNEFYHRIEIFIFVYQPPYPWNNPAYATVTNDIEKIQDFVYKYVRYLITIQLLRNGLFLCRFSTEMCKKNIGPSYYYEPLHIDRRIFYESFGKKMSPKFKKKCLNGLDKKKFTDI